MSWPAAPSLCGNFPKIWCARRSWVKLEWVGKVNALRFFFRRHLLRQTEGIDDLGEVQWPLIVCLVVSWAVCYMCLFKGIKSMGKVCICFILFCQGSEAINQVLTQVEMKYVMSGNVHTINVAQLFYLRLQADELICSVHKKRQAASRMCSQHLDRLSVDSSCRRSSSRPSSRT